MGITDLLQKWFAGTSPGDSRSGSRQYRGWDDPSRSYMVTEKYQQHLITELAGIVDPVLQKIANISQDSPPDTVKLLEKFFSVYQHRPFTNNIGGSSFHNSLWLYTATRTLSPELIVESGVWKGMSSYILQKAAGHTNLFGFDITLEHLLHRVSGVNYIERDWREYDLGEVDAEKSLVFFDCHVNHARRLIEAKEKGFKYIVVDDNPPAHKLYGYSMPPVPTVEMIMRGEFVDGERISWIFNDEPHEFMIDMEEIDRARQLVGDYFVFPDISSVTRYNSRSGSHSFLSFVVLS